MTKYVVLCIKIGTQETLIIVPTLRVLYENFQNSNDILGFLYSTTVSPISPQIQPIPYFPFSAFYHPNDPKDPQGPQAPMSRFPFLPTPTTRFPKWLDGTEKYSGR